MQRLIAAGYSHHRRSGLRALAPLDRLLRLRLPQGALRAVDAMLWQ